MAQKQESVIRRRSSLLCRPECHGVGADYEWNKLLGSAKGGQADLAILGRFYVEIKQKLIRKFGTITSAFKLIDASGDGSIDFVEWDSMLQLVNFPLENRISRWMFVRTSGGEKVVSLRDLKMTLLAPTLKKMKDAFRRYRNMDVRVNQHVQFFIKQLTQANRHVEVAAIDRFQRKLKVPCLRDLFERIASIPAAHQQMQSMLVEEITINYSDFEEMANSIVSTMREKGTFLDYQVSILLSIFSRVAEHGSSVNSMQHEPSSTALLVDLMTTLVLLSPDSDRRGKLKLLFDVFDSDMDMFLHHKQVSELFIWICRIRPSIFEDFSPSGSTLLRVEGGSTFQKELSIQEGLRNYECVRWRLARQGNIEGAVNFNELWQAIQDQPDVINSLAPGAPLIRWMVEQPSVDLSDFSSNGVSTQCATRRLGGGRGEGFEDLFSRVTTPPCVSSPMEDRRASQTVEALPREATPQRMFRRLAPLSRDAASKRLSKNGIEHFKISSSPDDAWPKNGIKARVLKSVQPAPNLLPSSEELREEPRPLTADFRKDSMAHFRHRLRTLGDLRLNELNDGFENPHNYATPSPSGSGDDSPGRGSAASFSLRPSSTCSSKPQLPRLQSSKSGSSRDGKDMQRGRTIDAFGSADERLMSLSSSMSSPGFNEQATLKWGKDAASRHSLLVAARHANGHKFPNMNAFDKFDYTCHLCGGRHALGMPCVNSKYD